MEQDVLRKCIVSGEVKEKSELLRFVAEQGHLVPDFQKKHKGKGIYVSNSKDVLRIAVEKHLFRRSARRQLKEEDEIVEIVENLMKKRGLDFLNLARKAGVAVSGFEKVCEKLKQNKVAFLLEANDAGADGKKKIAAFLQGIPVFDDLYTTEELDNALNKTNTVHIAFLKSDMAKAAYIEFERIKTFFGENSL